MKRDLKKALDDYQGNRFTNLPRRAYLTYKYHGIGTVLFRTVYPAWYPGRTPHIHFKVFLDGRNVLMGQTYLPDALREYLFANVAAYQGRNGQRDTFKHDAPRYGTREAAAHLKS